MTTMQQAIERNRRKHARYRRAETVLNQVRRRIFDYEDEGPEEVAKAERVIKTCKRILAPLWRARRAAAVCSRS